MSVQLTGTRDLLRKGDVELPLMYYRPAADGPHPCVVLAPGGLQGGLFEIMEWIGSRLAAAGFTAVTVSWRRGSPIDDPLDVSAAIDWAVDRLDIDPDRIGIMGMSRGAMSALRSAAVEPRIRTVVTFGAATDLIQQVRGVAVYAPGRYRMLTEWLGGPPDERREFYETVQAISYADRIKQPVLLVHGAHDMHCPPEQSVWMKNELERYGNHDVRIELIPMMCHYGDVIPNTFGFDHLASIIIPYLESQLARAKSRDGR
jgi:dipeptidyl aminopeptidase/acylaminoacyl peptidase